jgi:hypothetical protein
LEPRSGSPRCAVAVTATGGGCYPRPVPVHHDRSRVHEARISGLAILLSVAALALVLVYLVGGYANRVVIEVVAIPGPSSVTAP